MSYAKRITLAVGYEQAVANVKDAFKAKGFGVLTEIDVQATLKAKLDHEMEPYLIIGACNPNLARQALDVEPQIGLLLPCNVVVRQEGAAVIVEALDASLIASVPGNPALEPIAEQAAQLIDEALDDLVRQSAGSQR